MKDTSEINRMIGRLQGLWASYHSNNARIVEAKLNLDEYTAKKYMQINQITLEEIKEQAYDLAWERGFQKDKSNGFPKTKSLVNKLNKREFTEPEYIDLEQDEDMKEPMDIKFGIY